jgi:hypothetical protein
MDIIVDNKRRMKNVKLIIEGGISEEFVNFFENWDLLEYCIIMYIQTHSKMSIYLEFQKFISIFTIRRMINPFINE